MRYSPLKLVSATLFLMAAAMVASLACGSSETAEPTPDIQALISESLEDTNKAIEEVAMTAQQAVDIAKQAQAA